MISCQSYVLLWGTGTGGGEGTGTNNGGVTGNDGGTSKNYIVILRAIWTCMAFEWLPGPWHISDSHEWYTTQPTYNYPHLASQARTVQIVPGSRPDKAAWTR